MTSIFIATPVGCVLNNFPSTHRTGKWRRNHTDIETRYSKRATAKGLHADCLIALATSLLQRQS
jgi:hypothetical protein